MGKRYYCDYCERSFADGAENRKKHLASVHHQKLRKAHYDSFKDAATILEEDKVKKPCRKFHEAGFCEFGSSCKYSHLTPIDIQKLEEQALAEKMKHKKRETRVEPDIDSWLASKILEKKNIHSSNFDVSHSILPPDLARNPNLPPSLIPATSSEFHNGQKNISDWG